MAKYSTAEAALESAITRLANSLKDETAYQEAYGPRPSYSLDGESYSWPEWRTSIIAQIQELQKARQAIGGPFMVRSRVRT